MTWRNVAISAVVLLLVGLGGYGAGRFTTPAKIETKTVVQEHTQIEYRDRVVEKVVQGPVRTVTHTVTREAVCVAGQSTPVTDTTTVVDAGPVTIDHASDSSGSAIQDVKVETKTVTVYEQPRLMLQAGAASGTDLSPHYNLGASYRFAGPLWAGAAYHITDKRAELRLGLSF